MFKLSVVVFVLALVLYPAEQQAVEISKLELPDMGDSSASLMTAAEENQLGDEFFRYLHSEITISQDAEIQEYIQSVGEKLVANSAAPSNQFHFFVVLENDINAFAGPGGYIGVNSGLILITEAESELASVMAHEIGHVTQRHLFRSAEAANRMSIPSMAAMIAAIALGTRSAQMGQAALVGIQAGLVQFQINFTRQHEEEADRVGMETMEKSEYDPRSMPTFFERLQQSSRYSGQGAPEFLRTHPVTSSRISDTRGRAESYPYKQYPDSLAYQLTKAKIRVLTAIDRLEPFKYFQSRLKQGTSEQRTVARYGLGLAMLSLQKYNEAENIFQALTTEYPNQIQYATALARTAADSRNINLALARYKKLVERFPDNEAIRLEYIGILIKLDNAVLAQKNLLALSSETQKLPIFFQLLAQVYSLLKQPAESHRYLAEYYYLTGQTQYAILQIKLAKNSKGLNNQLAYILNERLNFFLTQLEQSRSNR